MVLFVSGNHEIEVAASVGYLFGAASEFAHDADRARSQTTVELIAGVFRYMDEVEHIAPIAVVSRTTLFEGSPDHRKTGNGHRSRAYVPDILYRHALPEIAVKPTAGDRSAVPAFMRTALGFTAPHRILTVCADPGAASAAEDSYAGTLASLVWAARAAALPCNQTDLEIARETALRVGRSLRLTRTQQHELERLAREWTSREGNLPSEIARFEGITPKSKTESSELLAELRVLLGRDGEKR